LSGVLCTTTLISFKSIKKIFKKWESCFYSKKIKFKGFCEDKERKMNNVRSF